MLRAMPMMGRFAAHGYYRMTIGGVRPPSGGPELVVANHTNSLVDVACVVVAARRPVRFMTKAPLFRHPAIGWLVKAVGSVPVYRRQDDPKLVAQNLDVFRDVHRAIAQGFAVGIFPEGVSHSASSLQPLKTGAARIALGAAKELGRAFPIVPVGMVFRDRPTFRSAAHVIVGASCEWDDLAARGSGDREAVRDLTHRIERSMRAVTLNLDSWQDEQLVRMAEQVWQAEFEAAGDPYAEITRLGAATEALDRLRRGGDPAWRAVARQLRAHERLLGRLGLTPAALRANIGSVSAAAWLVRRLPLLLLAPIAALGVALLWIPREVTGAVGTTASRGEGEDSIPTFRVMYGGVIFLAWFVVLGGVVAWRWGWLAGAVTVLMLPTVALAALQVGESRRFVWQAIRRYFVLRRHRVRVTELRQRQHDIAQRLKDLLRQTAAASGT